MSDQQVYVFEAKQTPHTTVIFVHGLFDTGEKRGAKVANASQGKWKVVAPTAPIQRVSLFDNQEVHSWFDIIEVKFEGKDDEEGIKKSSDYIKSLLDEQLKSMDTSQVVLVGYSQGAVLSLYTALTYDKPLAAVIAIAGWLPMAKCFPGIINKANENIKILLMHGKEDPVVNFNLFEQTKKYLIANKIGKPEFKTYPDMDHEPSDQVYQDIQQYIDQL